MILKRWLIVRVAAAILAAAFFGSAAVRETPSQVRYQAEIFSGARVTRDIVYTTRTDAKGKSVDLRLDLYEPEGDTALKRPLMVWIHGGGFFRGGKTDGPIVRLATHFAQCGYVCASIEYRLALKNITSWFSSDKLRSAVEAGGEDANAALCFLSDGQERFRLDRSKVIIGGGSAGAFIALQAVCGGKPASCGLKIRAVLDFWGGLLDTSLMTRSCPPILIVHGTDDRIVSYNFAERLVARAKETGVDYDLRALRDEGHSPWEHMYQYITWVHDFLDRRL